MKDSTLFNQFYNNLFKLAGQAQPGEVASKKCWSFYKTISLMLFLQKNPKRSDLVFVTFGAKDDFLTEDIYGRKVY